MLKQAFCTCFLETETVRSKGHSTRNSLEWYLISVASKWVWIVWVQVSKLILKIKIPQGFKEVRSVGVSMGSWSGAVHLLALCMSSNIECIKYFDTFQQFGWQFLVTFKYSRKMIVSKDKFWEKEYYNKVWYFKTNWAKFCLFLKIAY